MLTSQLMNENRALKSQVDDYKQKCARLERDYDGVSVSLQRSQVDCRQKEQELANMQQLVR